jgi:hypothetical protein
MTGHDAVFEGTPPMRKSRQDNYLEKITAKME